METKTSSSIGKSSFGQTLHFITDIKLQELEKQRFAYQDHAKVVDEARALGEQGDVIRQVEMLANAVKSWIGSGSLGDSNVVRSKLNLQDLEYWIYQARKDPSFNVDIAHGWVDTLEEHIRHNVMRFDAAKLFGNLFNEWIASGDSTALVYQEISESESDATSFVQIESELKEIRDQREKLESMIFDEYPVDVEGLRAYLARLFDSEEAAKELDSLRKNIAHFGGRLQRKLIKTEDAKYAIRDLLASGLMEEEKMDTLKAFEENSTVMKELTSVLNMRMNSLSSWSWPEEGLKVEFRRHLHGKYRAFTDPEIIDALLLHYIGVAWQVQLKTYLRWFFDSKAWISPPPPSTTVKDKLRIAQLPGSDGSSSIDAQRNTMRRVNFFLSPLREEASRASRYDDLVDAPDSRDEDASSPATRKRKLLHIITTECYLNRALHGSHVILQSDVEWFGPSLPHATILTVLEFLGMPKTWLDFFQAFLSAPLRFPGDVEPRTRRRGTPISYALSVFCGEAILFMMDLAVNQRANGLFLYRMHDDLWLWDSDPKKVADGWAEMKKYASHAGLKFNQRKTGSKYVGPPSDEYIRLPQGEIRWGFLKFDPQTSRFVIDQADVDHYILNVRRQLANTKSVFGWINAYNKNMAFFLRNFGGIPAACLGKAHVTDMIDTLARIQKGILAQDNWSSKGVIEYLKRTLEERFGVKNLPDGYFYFPIARGGLELRNTILELLALEKPREELSSYNEEEKEVHAGSPNPGRRSFKADHAVDWAVSHDEMWDAPEEAIPIAPSEFYADVASAAVEEKFTVLMEGDGWMYDWLKELWTMPDHRRRVKINVKPEDFPSFEEYTGLRQSLHSKWGETYKKLLEAPKPHQVELLPHLREMVQGKAGATNWARMDWYEKWLISMYGEEVLRKFGSLEAVDSDLIPVGMVELFRTSRMKLA